MSQTPSAPLTRSARLVALFTVLLISAFVLSACGLFGDDEQPEVVEPPAAAAQTAQPDQPAAAASETQQDDQRTEAVQVTTSPPQDDEAQPAQSAAQSAEAEAEVDTTIYVVQAGDTLAEIAGRLGVRMDDLITLNGIQNPDVLEVGQELRIPGAEADEEEPEAAAEDADEQQEQSDEELVEVPSVALPTVAVPPATTTRVSYTQFPQPGPEQTTDTIPDAPSNFLQYGAAALPWLHGIDEVEPIIDLFRAWPMPALAAGNDRIILVNTTNEGFSASIVYTNPNSFGAAVPFSNLVVYDPVPGDPSKYRIAYDHAQAYAREVQGIQQLADIDVTGDNVRDLTFREITCNDSGCVSSFYVLSAAGDGYQAISGAAAQVAEVSSISLEDLTGDGVPDLVVEGLAIDQPAAARYTFVFTAEGDELVEAVRLSRDGDSSDELEAEAADEESGSEADEDVLEEE